MTQPQPSTDASRSTRPLLPSAQVHPTVNAAMASFHRDVVDEVAQAVARDEWVLVGMATNPFVGRARKLLQSEGITFTELRYGGYASKWKERLAIKMWAGFPTFPMVFRKGVLLGGASELSAMQKAGTLKD